MYFIFLNFLPPQQFEFSPPFEEIHRTSQVTRVSSCFAYWRHQGQTYGVNFVSSEDCDRFCELSMETSRGVVKHMQTPFTDCVIKLGNNAAIVSVNGKDFSLNLYIHKI
uniref:WH1 domain-containing protein n=1 Tax=Parascaris equorum TaxID=6256 RepID=A0A914RQB7_PAREQ